MSDKEIFIEKTSDSPRYLLKRYPLELISASLSIPHFVVEEAIKNNCTTFDKIRKFYRDRTD